MRIGRLSIQKLSNPSAVARYGDYQAMSDAGSFEKGKYLRLWSWSVSWRIA